MDASQLGDVDGEPRPAAVDRRDRDPVGALQRAHGVAGERDREEQQDRGAGDQQRLHRNPPSELEDCVGHDAEGGHCRREPERNVEPQALREDRERLVEEDGLEALAVDGREAETGERDSAPGRYRPRRRGRA